MKWDDEYVSQIGSDEGIVDVLSFDEAALRE